MTGSGTRDRELAGPQDDADVYDGGTADNAGTGKE